MKIQRNSAVLTVKYRSSKLNSKKHAKQLALEVDAVSTDGQPRVYNRKLNEVSIYQPSTDLEPNLEPGLEPKIETNILPVYNEKSLTSDTYDIGSFNANLMIIFNHNRIQGYNVRTGTDQDVINLKETFGKYDFENIIEHTDLSRDQLRNVLKQFSESNFTEYGCVLVVALTHGMEDGYLLAKDYVYHESELIDPFVKNPTLVTKPKVFIIQACRGLRESKAVNVVQYRGRQNNEESQDEDLKIPLLHSLSNQADVLVLHSTYDGNVSYRDAVKGSWIIESLCRNMDKLGDKEHFEDILREVRYDVAIHKERAVTNKTTGEMDVYKQMPVVTSTLLRYLYFNKSSHIDNKSSKY